MELGAFSVSLTVYDLAASTAFYRKLGFEPIDRGDKWTVMVNGTTVIGLFERLFEENILTFNPGWAHGKRRLEQFTDVRELKARFEAQGVRVKPVAGMDRASGPASILVTDPDGNPILFDQHV